LKQLGYVVVSKKAFWVIAGQYDRTHIFIGLGPFDQRAQGNHQRVVEESVRWIRESRQEYAPVLLGADGAAHPLARQAEAPATTPTPIRIPAARRLARVLSSLKTAPLSRTDMIEPSDPADITEPNDAAEATESAEAAEPTDPIERTDPTDPTESSDPFEAIERQEPSDQRLNAEASSIARSFSRLEVVTPYA